MAIPPSAGNPVVVGPYKQIVAFHWPGDGDPGPTRYMTTWALLRSVFRSGSTPEEQVWLDPVEPWDGIAPPFSLTPDLKNDSIKERAWEEWPMGWLPEGGYFKYAAVYDEFGVGIVDDRASVIGASIAAPTLPQTYSFAQWEHSSVNGFTWPTQSSLVPNPMGLIYYSDSGILYQRAQGFLASPAVQNYRGGFYADPLTEMQTAMVVDYASPDVDVCEFNLRTVSATYDGQTYNAIGWNLSVDGFTTEPRVNILLRTPETGSA